MKSPQQRFERSRRMKWKRGKPNICEERTMLSVVCKKISAILDMLWFERQTIYAPFREIFLLFVTLSRLREE